MALVSVNGQDAIETRVTMPRIGVWHADVLVDDPDQLAGAATITISDGALVLKGTVVRSGVFADTGHVRIRAGAGGLGLRAKPRHYVGTSVRIVLGDLLAAAGETLSATADQSVLAVGLDAWTTSATPVGTLIALLLASGAPGASWRMLPDGTCWVGKETWADAGIDSPTYQVLDDGAETNTMRIGVDAPLALIGTTFEGRQVSATEANVGQVGSGVEMTVWFEDGAPGQVDRLSKAFTARAQRAVARTDRVDYGRMYPATIISQTGSTVDVQPEQVGGRDLLPDMAAVPLWLGLPGASVNTTSGGRVMVGWLGGDPARPVAIDFDGLSLPLSLVLAVQPAGGQLSLGAGGAPPAVLGAHQAAEAALYKAIGAIATTAAGASLDPASATFFGALATLLTNYATAAAAANNFLSTKVGIAP